MSEKKKILRRIAVVLSILIAVDCMFFPSTPNIDKWRDVVVHTTESGYWPPTDSMLDRIVIWLYMRTAIPVGSEESYTECMKNQVEKYGMGKFEVLVNVDNRVGAQLSEGEKYFQFVVGVVNDNILFDRMMFYDQSQGDDATYWITLPGFWKYLDSVHRRINPGYFEATGL